MHSGFDERKIEPRYFTKLKFCWLAGRTGKTDYGQTSLYDS